jgi:hypothetical protein
LHAFCGRFLLFEKLVESFSHIVALHGLRPPARSQRNTFVRFKVITEISLQFIFDVISLRFRALIVFARIKETAIFATMHVGIAVWTFVSTLDFAYDFDFSPAVVTNHNAPRKRLKQRSKTRPCSARRLDYQTARRRLSIAESSFIQVACVEENRLISSRTVESLRLVTARMVAEQVARSQSHRPKT